MRALILNGKIQTSPAKAKAVQPDVEKMINLAKRSSLSSKKQVYSFLGNDRLSASFVYEKIVPKFASKVSGFTRIVNLPQRVGDNSRMVRLEWSLEVEKYIPPTKKKNKSKPAEKGTVDKSKAEEKGKKGKFARIAKVIKKK